MCVSHGIIVKLLAESLVIEFAIRIDLSTQRAIESIFFDEKKVKMKSKLWAGRGWFKCILFDFSSHFVAKKVCFSHVTFLFPLIPTNKLKLKKWEIMRKRFYKLFLTGEKIDAKKVFKLFHCFRECLVESGLIQ